MKSVLTASKPSSVFWILFGLFVALFVSFVTYLNIVGAFLVSAICLFVIYLVLVFSKPDWGFNILIIYSFIFSFLIREIPNLPFGLGIELFLITIWLIIFLRYKNFNWSNLNNDLTKLFLIWFVISLLEIFNPAGASVRGWLQEIRSSGFYPIMITQLAFLFLTSEKKLDQFILITLSMAILGTINGLKQKYIGLFPGEQQFVITSPTHMIWGKLRVFSFLSDAGQFGASQASFAVIAFVLFLGDFTYWKKIALLAAGFLLIYGMLISGTRGAFFCLIVGGGFALFLSKNFKIMAVGMVILLGIYFFLKFTTIGNGIYEINRLRTSVDPQEASLNVRLDNQRLLRNYLSTRPFGGGLGVIGHWGKEYNSDKYLSTIEPDSYWVKVWAMYGIVGMILWFSMIMYIIGKCAGIIWKLKNQRLRVKLIALISSSVGLFVSSYGNEVMNSMPSLLMFCIPLSLVYMAPSFDNRLSNDID